MMTKQLITTQENHYGLTISDVRDSGLFDVTMGAYDGAEVCEFVGNYLHYEISKLYEKKDIGLYRDDEVAVLRIKVDQNLKKLISQFNLYFGRTN